MCERTVCPSCYMRTLIPPHMLGSAGTSNPRFADVVAGKQVLLCKDCRAELGGVKR